MSMDRLLDRVLMAALRQREDGVAHDQRRLGGIEDDDRLAALGAAELSIAFEVVSVNSSMLARVPGPADFEEIEATISPQITALRRARTA